MRDEDGGNREHPRRSDSVLDTTETTLDTREEESLADAERDSLSRSNSSSQTKADQREQTGSGPSTINDVTESLSGRSVTDEASSISATLMGVPRVNVHDFVYDHQLGVEHDPDETRSIAMFDLENTGQYPVKWRSSRTRFIGTNGYTYQPSQLSLDPSRLGPGCHTRQVEIEPDRRARVVTLVEQLPAGVEVVEVVHKVSTYGDSQRLTFSVE